jgi:O-acetyl-ADP-ribose deacetylase (regulator of RNase III)
MSILTPSYGTLANRNKILAGLAVFILISGTAITLFLLYKYDVIGGNNDSSKGKLEKSNQPGLLSRDINLVTNEECETLIKSTDLEEQADALASKNKTEFNGDILAKLMTLQKSCIDRFDILKMIKEKTKVENLVALNELKKKEALLQASDRENFNKYIQEMKKNLENSETLQSPSGAPNNPPGSNPPLGNEKKTGNGTPGSDDSAEPSGDNKKIQPILLDEPLQIKIVNEEEDDEIEIPLKPHENYDKPPELVLKDKKIKPILLEEPPQIKIVNAEDDEIEIPLRPHDNYDKTPEIVLKDKTTPIEPKLNKPPNVKKENQPNPDVFPNEDEEELDVFNISVKPEDYDNPPELIHKGKKKSFTTFEPKFTGIQKKDGDGGRIKDDITGQSKKDDTTIQDTSADKNDKSPLKRTPAVNQTPAPVDETKGNIEQLPDPEKKSEEFSDEELGEEGSAAEEKDAVDSFIKGVKAKFHLIPSIFSPKVDTKVFDKIKEELDKDGIFKGKYQFDNVTDQVLKRKNPQNLGDNSDELKKYRQKDPDFEKITNPFRRRIHILANQSILSLKVPAVVNPANPKCLGGGGVDELFHTALDSTYDIENRHKSNLSKYINKKLKKVDGFRCPEGTVRVIRVPIIKKNPQTNPKKILDPYIQYIFLSAPPEEIDLEADPAGLGRIYYSTLDRAEELGIEQVGVPALGTGVFAYPAGTSAIIALYSVFKWFKKHPDSKIEVFFVFKGKNSDHLAQFYRLYADEIFPKEIKK